VIFRHSVGDAVKFYAHGDLLRLTQQPGIWSLKHEAPTHLSRAIHGRNFGNRENFGASDVEFEVWTLEFFPPSRRAKAPLRRGGGWILDFEVCLSPPRA